MSEITAQDVLDIQGPVSTNTEQTLAEHAAQQAAEINGTAPEVSAPEVAPVPEAPKVDESFAKKFAALSRKEKQLKQQERDMQKKIADMEARMKAQDEELRPFKEFKGNVEKDPFEALQNAGMPYEKLSSEYILRPQPTEQDKVQQYIKSLEDKVNSIESGLKQREENDKKAQEEFKQKQHENARKSYLQHLAGYVDQNAEKYELIKSNDAVDLVYEVMDAHYSRTESENGKGEVLTEEQAADLVENHLLEEAKKIAQSKKIQGLLGVQAKPQQEPPKKHSGQSATLSNNMSQQVPTKSEKFLSDEESKRLISTMLKFNS